MFMSEALSSFGAVEQVPGLVREEVQAVPKDLEVYRARGVLRHLRGFLLADGFQFGEVRFLRGHRQQEGAEFGFGVEQ